MVTAVTVTFLSYHPHFHRPAVWLLSMSSGWKVSPELLQSTPRHLCSHFTTLIFLKHSALLPASFPFLPGLPCCHVPLLLPFWCLHSVSAVAVSVLYSQRVLFHTWICSAVTHTHVVHTHLQVDGSTSSLMLVLPCKLFLPGC